MNNPRKTVFFGSIFFVFSLCFSTLSWGDGFSLNPYSHSSLDSAELFVDDDYLIINSTPKRIRNELRVDNQRRVSVKGNRETYRVNEGHTSEQAFNHYLEELANINAEIIYQCSSRDCGRSSSWSETVYKIPKLYGKDATQYYLSSRLVINGAEWLMSVYTVERGNRRVYVHVEVLSVVNSNVGSESIERSVADDQNKVLDKNNVSVLAKVNFKYDGAVTLGQTNAELKQFSKQLQDLSTQTVYLVGHMTEEFVSVAEAIIQSKAAADKLAQHFEAMGVVSPSFETLGIGPLAPASSSKLDGNRVEILVVDQ